MADKDARWHTTKDEKKFIDNIGSFTVVGKLNSRLSLLKSYLNASEEKTGWGDVNKWEIISYLKDSIKKEEESLIEMPFNVLQA